MISPLRDNYRIETTCDVMFHPYKKGVTNFIMAFSKEKFLEPKRSSCTRKYFFIAGILYLVPILNNITYIFINVVLKNTRPALSYDHVIYEANLNFYKHKDKDKIIERIKKRLQECNYNESIKNKKKPHILVEKYDFYEGVGLDNEGIDVEEVNREAIWFIKKLPKMEFTLDYSYSEK